MNQGVETLSPASYLRNSHWLFEESRGTNWTHEENKRFENALALYDKDEPDRWQKVAALIPGKTVGDVIKQYRELEEDVSDIEAGLIPIPGYNSSANSDCFTLEWVDNHSGGNQVFDAYKHYYAPGVKRATRNSDHERKKGVPWTEEEHRQFLLGLQKYGKGDWRNISRNFVTTRTPTQVASHAQKYFIRQSTGGKDKRRSSIHDITTVNLLDTKSTSQDEKKPLSPKNSSTSSLTNFQPKTDDLTKDLLDWKPQSEELAAIFNSENGNFFMSPLCGMSSIGPKIQDQSLFRGTQFGNYNLVYQMQQMQRQ